MTTFADSSAVVKVYADEPGSTVVRRLGALVVSALIRVEIPSALWRKQLDGELDAQNATAVVRRFEDDYTGVDEADVGFAAIGLNAAVLEEAANRVASRDLRTLDALQLASAVVARQADPGCNTFACFDNRLRDAAAAAGFELLPSSL